MKRALFFFALTIIIFGNIVSLKIIESGKLNLNLLHSFISATAEEVPNYACSEDEWIEVYEYCTPTDFSACQFTEWDCWENPYGTFSSDISCSSIWCYDCKTGIGDYQYDDC